MSCATISCDASCDVSVEIHSRKTSQARCSNFKLTTEQNLLCGNEAGNF